MTETLRAYMPWLQLAAILITTVFVPIARRIGRSLDKAIGAVKSEMTDSFKEMRGDMKEVKNHLATLNGRMGRVEQWKEDHQRQADTVHHDIREDLRSLPCRKAVPPGC